LWVGQTGINALPELTSRLSRKVHNSRLIEPTLLAAYPLGGDYYPESFNEQTRYTGLLHHLEGIPQGTGAFSHIRKIVIPSPSASLRVNSAKRAFRQVALSGCGCATRIGCVDRPSSLKRNRLTIDETSSVTDGRNTQPAVSGVSQNAFIPALSYLGSSFRCLVRPIRQFICFTPAFIFNLLPRGPPVS
jgi:hypothetical protein